MSDYYRDRVRHGGILSNRFIKWWVDSRIFNFHLLEVFTGGTKDKSVATSTD